MKRAVFLFVRFNDEQISSTNTSHRFRYRLMLMLTHCVIISVRFFSVCEYYRECIFYGACTMRIFMLKISTHLFYIIVPKVVEEISNLG